MISKKKVFSELKILALLFIVAVFFVTFFSFSTSPLYPYYFGGDSAQFQTVGKAWASGAIPYRDMFDHKGPVIFFVDMLGYLVTGAKFGIWIIQIVAMLFTLLALWKIAMLAEKSRFYGVVAIAVSLIILMQNYVDGNMTEEYCLPFICFSIYGQLKFFENDSPKHSPRFAVLYGMAFSVCFLTRITNAIPVLVGVGIITILLLLEKEYKNLGNNIVAFLVGAFVIAFPFFVYFSVLGEFGDFMYGTIFYNIQYSNNMTSWVQNASGENWKTYFWVYVASWSVFITALLAIRRKSYKKAIWLALLGIAETMMFFKGALYSQYGMVTLPQIVLLLNEIIRLKANEGQKLFRNFAICVLAFFCFTIANEKFPQAIDLHNTFSKYSDRGWEVLMDYIPEEDRNSFVAYGGNDLKEIYLTEDILPCYKYFSIQEWHSSFSEEMKKNIYNTFATCQAKWILTGDNKGEIQDILDAKYTKIAENGEYTIYKLK